MYCLLFALQRKMYSTATIVAEPVIQCPFNPSHSIARSRIQKHIVKCEKNYPGDYKVMCPYNATHRVSGSDITEHILTCSGRMDVGLEFQEVPKQHGNLGFALCSEISSTIDCTENWDLEIDSDSKCDSESDYVSEETNMIDHVDIEDKALRPPFGYSEAAMKEVDDESFIDDNQSIVSGMAAGRGRSFSSEKEALLKKVGKGRGKPVA